MQVKFRPFRLSSAVVIGILCLHANAAAVSPQPKGVSAGDESQSPRVGLGQCDKYRNPSNPERTAQLVANYHALLERDFPTWGGWSLGDLSKLSHHDVTAFRILFDTCIAWSDLIPPAIRQELGDEAPAAFMRRIYVLTLRPDYSHETYYRGRVSAAILHHCGRETFIMPESFTATFADGRNRQSTVGEAMHYSIATEAFLEGGSTIVTPLPGSVTRALVASNPELKDCLEPPGPKVLLTWEIGAPEAYGAGFVYAGGFAANLDRSRWPALPDRAQLCRNLPTIEREIADLEDRDVLTRLAFQAGMARRKVGAC